MSDFFRPIEEIAERERRAALMGLQLMDTFIEQGSKLAAADIMTAITYLMAGLVASGTLPDYCLNNEGMALMRQEALAIAARYNEAERKQKKAH